MPAPLIWFGASAIAILAGAKYANDKSLAESVSGFPGRSDKKVLPVNGAIVTCGIFGLFEHTGIWIDGNILELKGNGLIRGISPNRFLQGRSGEHIYMACNQDNIPLVQPNTEQRAIAKLFSYSEYDVINNNCHKFVWQCMSGEIVKLTRFSELNQKMATLFATTIYWQPIA